MAVLLWYLVKNDAGQVRFYKLLELHGHVYLVTLYSRIAGPIYSVQPDQINMAVLFWYLVKNYASLRYCTVTFYKVPEQHGHV